MDIDTPSIEFPFNTFIIDMNLVNGRMHLCCALYDIFVYLYPRTNHHFPTAVERLCKKETSIKSVPFFSSNSFNQCASILNQLSNICYDELGRMIRISQGCSQFGADKELQCRTQILVGQGMILTMSVI